MAVEQALQGFKETESGESFSLQNPRLLKVELADVTIQAKLGAMVAYQGEVKFERAATGGMARLMKKVATGEGVDLMKVSGTGEVFLAFHAQEVHLVKLADDKITVNSNNLLAFEAGIDWDIRKVEGASGVLAGGLFNLELAGTGWVGLLSDGPPMLLELDGDTAFTDPQAAITWSSGVRTAVKTDVNLKTLIGRASGETLQMEFSGNGWVLVQPSEGMPLAPAAARRRAREPARRLAHLAPEGVDAGVPLVRHFLEGLVRFSGHHFEPRARDCLGNCAPEARGREDVDLAGQDQRRHGDLPEPVERIMGHEPLQLRLERLGGLRMREHQRLLDDLLHHAVRVRARRVDPQEERLHHRALAGRDVREPMKEGARGAEVGVRSREGAHQDEAADQLGMAKSQLLRDQAASGEAGDVCGRDVERAQDRGGVVGHHRHRQRLLGQRRAAGAAVVGGDQPVAVRKAVELRLPRLGGVAEPAEEDHVRSLSDLLDVDLDVAGAHLLAHPQPSFAVPCQRSMCSACVRR